VNRLVQGKGRWIVAGLLAAGTGLVLVGLIRTPEVPLATRGATGLSLAKVELAWNGDALLNEEAALRDPTPLFLPTRWNATDDALSMNATREPGGAFQDFAPKWTFPSSELKLQLSPVLATPADPARVFVLSRPDRPFEGIGQKDGSVTPLPQRGALIEVVTENSGQVVLRQPLLQERPPADGNWQPLEFLIAIDAAGIVRPPVLTESSQVAAVDSYFQDYLLNSLHIGERLSAGFYRVSIGP